LPQPLAPTADAEQLIWQQALDWLLLIHEQHLDATQHAPLQAWLAVDPRHRQAYARAERTWLLSGPALQASQPRPRNRRWALASAAAVLLAVVLGGPGHERNVLHNDGLQVSQHALADGSQVTLAPGSRLQLDFASRQRQVQLLAGQAFFDVHHDPQRPFLVQAAAVTVRVTGTAFEVARQPGRIQVSVSSGQVQVGSAGQPARYTLQAGQQLRWTEGSRQAALQVAPVKQLASWRQGVLLVEQQPLHDVLEQLRPYHPGIVLLLDPALGERRLSARLDLTQPQQALQLALQPLGGELLSIGEHLTLIRRRP
jgi:transmembrane sensor